MASGAKPRARPSAVCGVGAGGDRARVQFVVETSGRKKQCDGKSLPPLGHEAATFAARGSGGAFKLPQRVRAEAGRQTYFCAFVDEN